jgi:hypothetical protein
MNTARCFENVGLCSPTYELSCNNDLPSVLHFFCPTVKDAFYLSINFLCF